MSFDRRKSEAPAVARFADVTPRRARAPSWVSAQRRPVNRMSEVPGLKAPRLPSEFVHAIRQGLEEKSASRFPPATQAPASTRESVHAPSAQAAPVVLERIVHTVDPALNAAFQEAVEVLSRSRGEILEHTASQIAELAIIIARRVLAHELSLHPKLVLGLVNEGLEALGDWQRVVIRVGTAFAEARQELVERFRMSGRQCEVVVDPNLGAHGCIVETELGRVDESIEVRLATLLQALRPESEPVVRD